MTIGAGCLPLALIDDQSQPVWCICEQPDEEGQCIEHTLEARLCDSSGVLPGYRPLERGAIDRFLGEDSPNVAHYVPRCERLREKRRTCEAMVDDPSSANTDMKMTFIVGAHRN